MGLVNYYKDHIPNLASIAAPFYDLCKKFVSFKWNSKCTEAFEYLKHKLSDRITLVPIDYDKPYELYTDAFEVGIGAALIQEGKPVAFYSKKLNPAHQRYSVTKREAYALVMRVLHFKYYLIGQEFIVYTDHRALEAW